MEGFDHERLEVYRLALDFVALVYEVIQALPPGHSRLADQIERASTSVVLNTAEGAGEFSKKEKARFYRMALRSATESAAVLDIFHRLRLVEESQYSAGRRLALRIVSMHVRLARNCISRGTGVGTGTGTGTGRPKG